MTPPPSSAIASRATASRPSGRRRRRVRADRPLYRLPMPTLPLTPDELLTTTRSVKRRLDPARPVAPDLLEECVQIAVQAPTSTNSQTWHFVIITDPNLRAAVATRYRRAWSASNGGRSPDEAPGAETRTAAASRHLAAHLHEVPAHVIPCVSGRPEGASAPDLAALYGSIIQAGWSFQLAARARGLGSAWTTYHLDHEQEVAELLGIPFGDVTQVALIPVAHTIGTTFRPAKRRPLETVIHWQRW
jgi:nitroreductase